MEAVGENNKFKDFLLKVYRKKIKRAKQKKGETEGKENCFKCIINLVNVTN